MCGIICLLQYGNNGIDLKSALSCLAALKPRGPDNQSHNIVKINDNLEIFMGFTRLAIMDTSDAGLQPFADDANIMVCNGEIYNFRELAKKYEIDMKSGCDCEILIPLFNKLGFENSITTELDAEFATILLSKNNNKIYAARDRFGVRPLYYGYNITTKTIGFASELKALHSIMEYVEQVKPNLIYSIDITKYNNIVSTLTEKHEYYSYNDISINLCTKNVDYIHEQIRHYLTESVKKRIYADRPIGFLLSGGLDSSLIVAIASRFINPDNIVCFSVGIEGSPDVEASKKVVDFLKIKNHHIIPFDVKQAISILPTVIKTIETYDITTIRASTPQYIMAKYINENTDIKVLLSGEGSDEIHGSYRYFRDAPNLYMFHLETIRLLEELYLFDNKRTDRTMADNGLEVRIPFLDIAYVKFITQINPLLLMYSENYMEKKLVRDSFKGYLPDEILYRSKEAFSDAVSNNEINWANTIKSHSDLIITNDYLQNNEFVINKPKTKDALYFRKIFNSIYPNMDNIIPHYWLPKFQIDEVLDPSARILKCY